MNNTFAQTAEIVILQSRRQAKKSSPQSDQEVLSIKPMQNPLLIADALEKYLKEHAEFEKRTKADYRDHFRYLERWASEEGFPLTTVSDLTLDLATEYRAYLIEDYSRSTVNIRLRTLKAFLGWAHKKGYVPNFAHSLKLVTVDEDFIRYLKDNEVQRLLHSIEQEYYEGFRDYVLVCLLLDCGARISEGLAIEWDMIDFDHNTIELPGRITKNGQTRTVPLSAATTVPLLQRLQQQNRAKFPEQTHLFLSYRRQKLSPSTVRHLFINYAKRAGIQRLSPHMLRHTFARMYVRSGGNVYALRDILGHATLDMSMRYVRLVAKEIAEEHQRISPVDRFVA